MAQGRRFWRAQPLDTDCEGGDVKTTAGRMGLASSVKRALKTGQLASLSGLWQVRKT